MSKGGASVTTQQPAPIYRARPATEHLNGFCWPGRREFEERSGLQTITSLHFLPLGSNYPLPGAGAREIIFQTHLVILTISLSRADHQHPAQPAHWTHFTIKPCLVSTYIYIYIISELT